MKYKVKNDDFRAKAFHTTDGITMVEPGKSATFETADPIGPSEGLTVTLLDGEENIEPGPLDGSVESLAAHLATLKNADEVQALIDSETAGKSRKGALSALEARRDALLAE